MSTSFTRALIAANPDAFDACLADETTEYLPTELGERTMVRVRYEIICTPEQLEAAHAIKERGLLSGLAAAARPEPDPALALSREDITLRPRIAHGVGVTGWEAQLDGRLPSGERIVMTADGMVSRDARSNLERMIEKEGWWIRG